LVGDALIEAAKRLGNPGSTSCCAFLKEEVVFLVVGMDTDFVFGFHDRLTFEKSSKRDIFVTVFDLL
jgi:hypothetical protein